MSFIFTDYFHIATIYHDPLIQAILLAVVLDIITGLAKAIAAKRLNSTISTSGIVKQVMFVIVPAMIQPIMVQMGIGDYWHIFAALCLLTIVISISENWIALGLPFPSVLSQYIDNEKKKLNKQKGHN